MSWLTRWNSGVGSSKDDKAAEKERRRIARINELNRQLEEHNRRLREIEAEQKQIEQGVKELETCHECLVSAIIDSEVIGQFDNVLSDADAYSSRYNELNAEKTGISSSISAITSELSGLGGTPVAIEKIVARTDLSTNRLSVFKNTYTPGAYNYYPDAMAEAIKYASKAAGTLGDSKVKLNNGVAKDSVAGLYNKLTNMKKELDKLNGELLGYNSNLLGNINLVPEVAAFLNENKGKYVQIPAELRKQLGLKMDGYIQIPSNFDLKKQVSMVVNLPGSLFGASAENNGLYASFIKSMNSGSYRTNAALIYTPFGWAYKNDSGYLDYRNSRAALQNDIEVIANNFNVNKNAISLMGYSLGGFAAAGLAAATPGYYSAVAICGADLKQFAIQTEDIISNCKDTTFIWVVGSEDTAMNVNNSSLEEYKKMKEAGLNTVYYRIEGGGHTDVCEVYSTDELINDLAGIRKGGKYNVPDDVITIDYHEFAKSSIDGERLKANYYVNLSNRQASESLNTASNGVIAYSQQGFQDENGVWHDWNEIYNWRSVAGNDIADGGCSLAATASAIATQLHDSSINPATIGLVVGNGSNHGHGRMMSAIERYGLDCTDQIGLSDANQRQFIENGGVILFSGPLGSNSDSGAHWYTILGIDNNGEYIIGNSYEQNGFGSEIPYKTGAAIYIAPKGYTVEQTLNSKIPNGHPNRLTTLEGTNNSYSGVQLGTSSGNETLNAASAAVVTAEAWAQTVAGKKAITAAIDSYGNQTTGQYIIKDLGKENNYMGNSIPKNTMDAIIEREYNKYLSGHPSGSTGGTTINEKGFSGLSGKFGTDSGTIKYSDNPAKNTVNFGVSPESFKNENSTYTPSNSGGSYNGGSGYYGGDSYVESSNDTPIVETKEIKTEPKVENKIPEDNKDTTTIIETNNNNNNNDNNNNNEVNNNEKIPEIIDNDSTNQTQTSTDIDNKNPVTIIDRSTVKDTTKNTQKSNVKYVYTSNNNSKEEVQEEITPKTDFNVDGRFVDVPYNAPLTTEECPTDETSINTSISTSNVTKEVIQDVPIFDVSTNDTTVVGNNKNTGVDVGKVVGGIAAVGGVVAAGVAAKKLTDKVDNNYYESDSYYEDGDYYVASDSNKNSDDYEEENYFETTDNYKNYNYEPEGLVLEKNVEEEKDEQEEKNENNDTYDLMNRKDVVIPNESDY